jgi:hypothetical protein
MRIQLLDALHLVGVIEQATDRIMGPMHDFAIGRKAMKVEVRKEVYADLIAIDKAARKARRSFDERPHESLWGRGERYWK